MASSHSLGGVQLELESVYKVGTLLKYFLGFVKCITLSFYPCFIYTFV